MTAPLRALLIVLTLACGTACAEPTCLFDGESLAGWKVVPAEAASDWKVADGVILAENPEKVGSNLWTEAEYGDYEITLEYRATTDYYDTGVFVRGESHQVQIGISSSLKKDLTASVYAPVDGRGGYPAKAPNVEAVQRVDEWNELRVVVRGSTITTFLNGEPMVEYEAAKMPASGPIGLQLHANSHMRLEFRKLVVTEID